MKFFYIFNHFAILYDVWKFIRFDHQSTCATSATVGHSGCRSNRRSPWQLGQRSWAPTGVKANRRGPRRLRPIRRALRRQA
jgi:hypothetical protein